MSDDNTGIIPFPQPRVPGTSTYRPVMDLRLTPLARQIDSQGRDVADAGKNFAPLWELAP